MGKEGNGKHGERKDSEASDALIKIIDKPDPRPVYISIWGDCSVVAQAIWRVKQTRSGHCVERRSSVSCVSIKSQRKTVP